MSTPSFLPANLLAAAFPATRRRQISIRAQEAKERADAKRALLAEANKLAMWDGADRRYAFTVVTRADRSRLNAAPVVLLAMRRSSGEIAGIRAFEAGDRPLLNAWIDRAATVADIELHARFNDTSPAERTAVVADLSPRPAPALVVAGKFDLRAIMVAAHAAARAAMRSTGAAWGACFSAALSEVWQAAKAARAEAA